MRYQAHQNGLARRPGPAAEGAAAREEAAEGRGALRSHLVPAQAQRPQLPGDASAGINIGIGIGIGIALTRLSLICLSRFIVIVG